MNTALSFGLADLFKDLQLEEFTQFPGLPIELRLGTHTGCYGRMKNCSKGCPKREVVFGELIEGGKD
jgi:hypothetical protein